MELFVPFVKRKKKISIKIDKIFKITIENIKKFIIIYINNNRLEVKYVFTVY